jgi:hypothetical protein
VKSLVIYGSILLRSRGAIEQFTFRLDRTVDQLINHFLRQPAVRMKGARYYSFIQANSENGLHTMNSYFKDIKGHPQSNIYFGGGKRRSML